MVWEPQPKSLFLLWQFIWDISGRDCSREPRKERADSQAFLSTLKMPWKPGGPGLATFTAWVHLAELEPWTLYLNFPELQWLLKNFFQCFSSCWSKCINVSRGWWHLDIIMGWPTVLVFLRQRGFVGYMSYSGQTTMVLGNLGWVGHPSKYVDEWKLKASENNRLD